MEKYETRLCGSIYGAEYEGFVKCSSRISRLRKITAEMGSHLKDPTVIYALTLNTISFVNKLPTRMASLSIAHQTRWLLKCLLKAWLENSFA